MVVVVILQNADVEFQAHACATEGQFHFRNNVDHKVIAEMSDASARGNFDHAKKASAKVQRRNGAESEFDIAVISGNAVKKAGAGFVGVRKTTCNINFFAVGQHHGATIVAVEPKIAVQFDKSAGTHAVSSADVDGGFHVVHLVVGVHVHLGA